MIQAPVKRYRRTQDIVTASNCSDVDTDVNSATSMRTRSSTRTDRIAHTDDIVSNVETTEVSSNIKKKLVPWGTDGRLPLSGDFRSLILE